jgi:ubiquinone/menaquinone biosynthesis C-methylase UbiE
MSDQPRKEHPSTYVVQDRDNQEELARLQLQDQMITRAMGGVLPEQPDPTSFQRVLDIGCGTGGWLIEAAKTYPTMIKLYGVDTSGTMLEYARKQAEASGVQGRFEAGGADAGPRIEFVVMDALRMLEFPTHFFDLVNMRFAQGWIRTWEWPKLLQEAQRVSKPGGVIRFTEVDVGAESSSPALNRLYDLTVQAAHRAGYYFTPDSDSVITHLPGLMHRHGVLGVQTRHFTIEFRAGTPEGQSFAEDMKLGYRTGLPFLKKWIRVPDDYETTYQQMLAEMQAPNFVASWNILTAWGSNEGFQVFFNEVER